MNNMNNLKSLQSLIEELNLSNSSNDKKEVLKKYSECKSLLFFIYNPFFKYNITSDNLKKRYDLVLETPTNIPNIEQLLEKLYKREVTGHEAIKLVNRFIEENQYFAELIYKIVDRDLEIRIGIKGINDVFENLIPEFSVALANSYKDRQHKVNLEKEDFYVSRKLDGCRNISIIDCDGEITFFSRAGKEFLTLDTLKKDIRKLNLTSVVLDGELCLVDDNGNENFQDVMKQINKKNHTIQTPRYKVFDILTTEEFLTKKSKEILTNRLNRINFEGSICIEKLEQIKVHSKEELNSLNEEAISNGWEGLILRKNTVYEGKRTNNMLKVKQFFDAEYKVLDIELGEMDDGHGNKINVLSNIIIEHKGNKVGVGSGFTIEERVRFYNNPAEILNKEVTIQYFAESLNQKGEYSLRFPVIKVIHGDKREV